MKTGEIYSKCIQIALPPYYLASNKNMRLCKMTYIPNKTHPTSLTSDIKSRFKIFVASPIPDNNEY